MVFDTGATPPMASTVSPFTLPLQLPTEMLQTLKLLNLTEGEYRKICMHLGREPNENELAMFSVLWSEHCCYKNSRHLLKTLPTQGERVVQGPGENAGVVDLGDGIQVAFKIESHNHPTAVEPFQGAATGVGGILRDIFTMNARPVASLNALRFGPLSDARNKRLFKGAVAGIAHYGNCVGVPTIAGDVFFDDRYSGNPLVNAMSIGLVYDQNIMPSAAKGIGNPILYVGSSTGKDGMGGAAFASRELDEKSNEDRPAVQVGDPFAEKLLIESCLEAFATGCVVAAQDMGAAGLTSSSCEMAAKGGVGIVLDLDKVPAREPGMKAYEYLLSESQERMLFVLEKGKEQPVLDIFAKWRVPAVMVGEVVAGENVTVKHHSEIVVDLPVALLTDLAPSYDRGSKPTEPDTQTALRLAEVSVPTETFSQEHLAKTLKEMMNRLNLAQPNGVFLQYDRHVQNNTRLSSENASSGVISVRDKAGQHSGKKLSATVDCNPRYVYLEPYVGTISAVCEAVRNLVSVGATPLAVTNNLNFGNPEKPEIYYQLYYSVAGIKDACIAFKTPVTGGNVSLYNEFQGTAIFPTPVIGMIGLHEKDQPLITPALKTSGQRIGLIGRFKPTLAGSEYQQYLGQETLGAPPDVSLNDEVLMKDVILQLIRSDSLSAVQDVSLGGLLCTLVEMTFAHQVGLNLNLQGLLSAFPALSWQTLLFGETNGCYLIGYDASAKNSIEALIKSQSTENLALYDLGEILTTSFLHVEGLSSSPVSISLEPVQHAWKTGLTL
jgi:phosphoribosylformylglycinamidine synthase subunit PurL